MINAKNVGKNTKPEKKIYDNQDKIIEIILEKLRKDFPNDCEAFIFGSVANKKFGKYIEDYKGHKGSDIDVIVFLNKNEIPVNWKYLNVSKEWWDLYRGQKIEINDTIHKTDILLVKKGFENIAKKRIQEKGWKIIKIIP